MDAGALSEREPRRSLIRAAVCKAIYTWWPAKDVFAAGVVEVRASDRSGATSCPT